MDTARTQLTVWQNSSSSWRQPNGIWTNVVTVLLDGHITVKDLQTSYIIKPYTHTNTHLHTHSQSCKLTPTSIIWLAFDWWLISLKTKHKTVTESIFAFHSNFLQIQNYLWLQSNLSSPKNLPPQRTNQHKPKKKKTNQIQIPKHQFTEKFPSRLHGFGGNCHTAIKRHRHHQE